MLLHNCIIDDLPKTPPSSPLPASLPCLPILVLLHHFQPLQGLEDPAGHTLRASAEVAGHDAISLTSPIDLCHRADPSAAPEVQVPCCGGWEGCEGDLRTLLRQRRLLSTAGVGCRQGLTQVTHIQTTVVANSYHSENICQDPAPDPSYCSVVELPCTRVRPRGLAGSSLPLPRCYEA